jgi:hypothetical protein
MTSAPETLREQAQEWGRSLLQQAPWEPLSERLSLILASPLPNARLAAVPPRAVVWLLVDRASAGSLPEAVRKPLLSGGALVQRHAGTATSPAVELAVRTAEGVEAQLERTGRRDFEVRWTLLHATVIADRLRRLEALAARARLLPPDGLERAVRELFLEAHAAARGVWAVAEAPSEAMSVAGELAGALLRLGCLLDHGAYPTGELLRSEASDTRIGMRLGVWLDDLGSGLGGDEAAGRRAASAVEQVLEEVRTVLRERYASRDWLVDPAAYELRSRR